MSEHDATSPAEDRARRTALWRRVEAGMALHPGRSAFTPLSDGIEALAARLLLARHAERAIDAQYYFVVDDTTGRLFISQLLECADRGVRVRLLLDDIATRSYDVGMALLDRHPNFEIRIFNPFSSRLAWMLDFITNFERANRRMHNKSFTVDGMATVVGGRNIGAEYFSADEALDFGDLDLLGFGPVARDVGFAFDEFWDSDLAMPVSELVATPRDGDAGLDGLRATLAETLAASTATPYGEALRSTVLERLDPTHPRNVVWAVSRVVFDAPAKARGEVAEASPLARNLSESLLSAVLLAETDLLVVSPYFVPQQEGVEVLVAARTRGVKTRILTNSLAASDVAAVHGGYAPKRAALLERGIELYETRAARGAIRMHRPWLRFSRGSLHAKVFLIDRRYAYVGSFNWDPRSVGINTEMGILVDSPEIAAEIESEVEVWIREDSWRVELTAKRKLRWTRTEAGRQLALFHEPEAGFWRRVLARLVSWLPIHHQL